MDLMRVYLARGSICKKLFDGPNGMYVCPGKVDMYMNLSISFFFSSEKLSLIYSEVSNKRACTFTTIIVVNVHARLLDTSEYNLKTNKIICYFE